MKITFFMAVVIILAIQSCTPPPPTGKIILQETQFKPGEEIKINFTTEGTFGKSPWIGIVESSVLHGNEELNDANDLSYQYFDGLNEGKWFLLHLKNLAPMI